MMKFKKFLAAAMTGAMMFGMVATAAPAVSAYAASSDKTEVPQITVFSAAAVGAETTTGAALSQPKINYGKMTATITSNDPYVFLEVYKDPSNADKIANTYVFPTKGGQAVVDLGFYKATKDFGIRVYGSSNMTDTGKSEMLTVKAQPSKLSLKVDTSQANLVDALTKAGKSKEGKTALTLTEADLKNYSFRSLYGSDWDTLDNFDYDTAKVAGTTIVVRKDAVETGENAAPAGPEAKVKIAASSKAPKVTIDYVKGTAKVTDKMEIALLGSTALTDKDYQQAGKTMTIDAIAELVKGDVTKGFTVAIRTRADKKAASMPQFLYIKAKPAMTASSSDTATVKIGEETTTVKVENNADSSAVKVTVTGTASLQYEVKAGKWAALANGTEIKGVTELKVRVAPEKEDKKVAGSGSFASDEVTIKPAASATTE